MAAGQEWASSPLSPRHQADGGGEAEAAPPGGGGELWVQAQGAGGVGGAARHALGFGSCPGKTNILCLNQFVSVQAFSKLGEIPINNNRET